MSELVLPLLFGAAMFLAGWFAHAWFARPADEPAELGEAEVPKTTWVCPRCQRRRQLPTELDEKVLLCNNCQVRLVRAPSGP